MGVREDEQRLALEQRLADEGDPCFINDGRGHDLTWSTLDCYRREHYTRHFPLHCWKDTHCA